MNRPEHGGCTNYWCVQLRGGLAYRADTAEKAMRSQTHEIRALRAEVARLKASAVPVEHERVVASYVEFKARAWLLFAVILIVIGAGLISVVLIGEHIMNNTVFNDVRTPG